MLDQFQEICRSSFFLNRIEESSITWCNSHLAARTDKGIHLYGFSKNPKFLDKKLDFIQSFIKTPTSSPCSELLMKKLDKSQLKNKDFAEMILDTAFWPHSDLLAKDMNTVVSFEWSPRNILPSDECVLAIVNNTGGVELFVTGRNEWKSVLDLSNLIHDQFSEISQLNPISFEDIKLAVYNLESCSICWSPNIREGASYLVTGQKNGVILFWMIECANENITARCCGKFESDFDEIVTLKWIPKSGAFFTLISTNIHGQISAFECRIDEEIIVLIRCNLLWEHQDRMLVHYMQHEVIGNNLLLIFHKHRHLVVHLFDENFKTVSQVLSNVNDHRITSIVWGDGDFYTSTVNFKLYRIKYVIENNVLKVNLDLVKLKDISETSELYGVAFSTNKSICALSMIERKVSHKKEKLQLEIIFLNVLPSNSELDILLNNPTKQLNGYWDYIQLLRLKIVKSKALPQYDYVNLLSLDNLDMYKLKIYLFILTIYKSLEIGAKIQRISLPDESIETLKDKILVAQAKTNIVVIYSEHCRNKPLSDIKKECYMASRKYIQFFCKKYNIPQDVIITQNKLELAFENIRYSCQNCDEEIIDFSCKNGHLNMICMLTFTPIESIDYLSCKYCGSFARIELKSDKTKCIFCDSYISDSHLPV